MGGMNHQPTNVKATATSAWLSKQIGDATIALHRANNFLEDAIIHALAPYDPLDIHTRIDQLRPAESLDLSRFALFEMKASVARIDEAFTELLELCDSIGYTGNRLSGEIGTYDLRGIFKRHDVLPKINDEAWRDVESRIRTLGILETLRWEQGEFRKLANPINALITVTNHCTAIAEHEGDQALVDAIEHNGVSYRQHYARVFSTWNQLHAVFLYSALMMTELFYRANDLGTLTETDITEKKAVLAA